MSSTAEDEEGCEICRMPFKPDDDCAVDINMGIVHFGCLEGSPVVDLDTGDPLPEGAPLPKFKWPEVSQ